MEVGYLRVACPVDTQVPVEQATALVVMVAAAAAAVQANTGPLSSVVVVVCCCCCCTGRGFCHPPCVCCDHCWSCVG